MDISNLSSLVPLKHSLHKNSTLSQIVDAIVSQIQAIPNYQLLRNDIELLLYACNICEHLAQKGTDKQDLVLQALIKLFCLDSNEQEIAKNAITFLWNNKTIKKLSNSSVCWRGIKAWLKKKFL